MINHIVYFLASLVVWGVVAFTSYNIVYFTLGKPTDVINSIVRYWLMFVIGIIIFICLFVTNGNPIGNWPS